MGKKKTNSSPISDDVLSTLDSKLGEQKQVAFLQKYPRIPGSFTSAEYAERKNIALSSARQQLLKLVRAGVLKQVRIPGERNGYLYPTEGYVLVEKGKGKG